MRPLSQLMLFRCSENVLSIMDMLFACLRGRSQIKNHAKFWKRWQNSLWECCGLNGQNSARLLWPRYREPTVSIPPTGTATCIQEGIWYLLFLRLLSERSHKDPWHDGGNVSDAALEIHGCRFRMTLLQFRLFWFRKRSQNLLHNNVNCRAFPQSDNMGFSRKLQSSA